MNKQYNPNQDFPLLVLPLVYQREGWYSSLIINLGSSTAASASFKNLTVKAKRQEVVWECKCIPSSTFLCCILFLNALHEGAFSLLNVARHS